MGWNNNTIVMRWDVMRIIRGNVMDSHDDKPATPAVAPPPPAPLPVKQIQ